MVHIAVATEVNVQVCAEEAVGQETLSRCQKDQIQNKSMPVDKEDVEIQSPII